MKTCMSNLDVSLGNVIKIIKELRQLRDSLRNKLIIKVPREYIIGNADVAARPMFTDGFVVTFRVNNREYRVWWSSIENALEGRNIDWGDYRVEAGKEPRIEFLNPDGSKVAVVRLDEKLVNELNRLINTAFSLFIIDWFIEDDIKSISNITNILIPENYTELRNISDFVETIHTKLNELGIMKELEDGVRKIELECHANKHEGRDIVEVIPVGRYYLCPECLRRAEKYVDETLDRWSNVKTKVPNETWQALQKSIDYIREMISNTQT